MKYLVGLVCLLFSVVASAQFFVAGMGAGSQSAVEAGSGSIGGSVGPGQYVTGGISGAGAGATAFSGAQFTPGPGLVFSNGGASGVLSGSAVGGASGGQAAAGSAAGATGSASHQAAGGVLLVLP